jgi:hypothetical protein
LPGTLVLPWVTLDDIGDAMAAALSGVWETRVNLLSGPQPIDGNMMPKRSLLGRRPGCRLS